MILSQNWVGYLDRSYEQIKRSVLRKLSIQAPELTDHTESNPLIVILSAFAGIAEMLNLYIDNMAREVFIGTARKYSSLVKLSRLLDYTIKAKNPASVDLLFTLEDSNKIPITHTADVTIPVGILVTNLNGTTFRTTRNGIIKNGTSKIYIPAIQASNIADENIGITSGIKNQRIDLPFNYVHDSLRLMIGTSRYEPFSSFAQMFNDTQGFIVDIDENSVAHLILGDGTNGIVPPAGLSIFASYSTTDGELGNTPPNTITEIITIIPLPSSLKVSVNNPDYASGGRDFETSDEIRNRAPRSLRTLDRAVTYQDHIDAPLLVPGIGDAEVRFCCGRFIYMYIVPNTRGIATLTQIEKVQQLMEKRKMLGTFIDVSAAGITKIWLKGKIYIHPGISELQARLQVAEALDVEYGYSNIQINRSVAASDIIALIETLPFIDRFELSDIRILPYARAVNNTLTPLIIEFLTLPVSTTTYIYTIQWNGTTFEVYRNATLLGTITAGQIYNDPLSNISFRITASSYTTNGRWEFTAFKSYPQIFPVTLIEIKDYSAPIVEVDTFVDNNTPRNIYSDLTFITQAIKASVLPTC